MQLNQDQWTIDQIDNLNNVIRQSLTREIIVNAPNNRLVNNSKVGQFDLIQQIYLLLTRWNERFVQQCNLSQESQ